jgi:hypothetical protein
MGPRFLLSKDSRFQLYRVVRARRFDCGDQVSRETMCNGGTVGKA